MTSSFSHASEPHAARTRTRTHDVVLCYLVCQPNTLTHLASCVSRRANVTPNSPVFCTLELRNDVAIQHTQNTLREDGGASVVLFGTAGFALGAAPNVKVSTRRVTVHTRAHSTHTHTFSCSAQHKLAVRGTSESFQSTTTRTMLMLLLLNSINTHNIKRTVECVFCSPSRLRVCGTWYVCMWFIALSKTNAGKLCTATHIIEIIIIISGTFH